MFQKVPNQNVGFTLPGVLTAVLKHLKKISRKTFKNLLILAGLTPFLFTRPAIAQVRTAVPQTVAVPSATQTTTDEDTQKRIEELIAQLGDKNWRVRQSAADTLGKTGDPQVVQPLIKVLRDRDQRVRLSAVKALSKIDNPQLVKALCDVLGDQNDYIRLTTLRSLVEVGDSQAVQPLIKTLGDKQNYIRKAAIMALGKIGQPAVQPLIKALEDENWLVRQSAADALGKIGQPAVQSLIKTLEDENWFVRESAADALGEIGDPQAVQPLIKALSDSYSRVRQSASDALGRIGDPQAVDPLIKALEDENESVRRYAAGALRRIGDPRAVQPLIKALKDEDMGVRQSAVSALERIDDPQAERALRKRALARKAREVLLVVSKLLVLCALVFLLVAGLVRLLKSQRHNIVRILKYIKYNTETGRRALLAILVYLALVIVNVICPNIFIGLGFDLHPLFWMLGGRWLSITTGGFLVLVYENDLGDPMYYLLSLAYFAVFFLPLFVYLFFKKRNAKITCARVQFVFIICHAAVIYVLITRYDLVHRMIDVIRF